MKTGRTRPRLGVLLCALCIAAIFSGTAAADDKPFFLSPTASWYFPTSGKVKNAFGSTWSGFGVSLNPESLGWQSGWGQGDFRLYPYMGFFRADERNNDAYIIPLGLEARWTLGQEGNIRTYAALGVSAYGVKFEDQDAGVDSGWKAAYGGRVALGMDFTKWLNVQAAYNLISDVKAYDFSGFSIRAKIKFYF